MGKEDESMSASAIIIQIQSFSAAVISNKPIFCGAAKADTSYTGVFLGESNVT